MTHRTLGRTGYQVSLLGFGAAPAAYLDTERQKATRVVAQLLDSGVNFIDTAASYPGSEEFLGEFFAARRREFVLISKCGMKIPESDAPSWSAKLIADTIERSLRLLRTDHLDAMLLHSCDLQTLKRGEAIGALVRAREAGKIRHAGYSGDNDAAAFAAAHPEIVVIETSLNIVDQINIDRVLPVAREHNVGVIAKRPVANAAWKALSAQPGMYQDYAKTYTERFAKMKLDPKELGFKGAPDQVWPEVALRFAISFPEVHTAIVGTTSLENARRNIDYGSKGPLPADALQKIRDAFRRADPRGTWLGQT
jgi:aryl-alcohol dehydrogenase-like predicted oxidoreductase